MLGRDAIDGRRHCAAAPATPACCSTGATRSRCCWATGRMTRAGVAASGARRDPGASRADPGRPAAQTRRAAWCSVVGCSARVCWRSREHRRPPASAAPQRACCATSRSTARPPTSAPGCCSSTSDRGATRRCATPGCPRGSAPSSARRAVEHRAKILLIRRFNARADGDGLRVFAAYADPLHPRLESGTVADAREVLDLDLGALRAGGIIRAGGVRRLALLGLHQRPPRRLLCCARPAGRQSPRRRSPRGDVGDLAHRG